MNRELQFDFSQFEEKFKQLLKSYNVNKKVVYTPVENKIAAEVSIRLAEKEVIRSVRDFLLKKNTEIRYSIAEIEANLENCSKSLLLIRQFLEDKEVEIGVVNRDSYLALLIDFALSGVKQFLNFDQYYIVSKRYRREYIDALFKIRRHLLLTIENIDVVAGGLDNRSSISSIIEYLKGVPDNKNPDTDLYYDVSQKEFEFPDNLPPFHADELKTSSKQYKIGFRWYGTKKQLELLYHELIENKAISRETELEDFNKVFDKAPIEKQIEITWLLKDTLLCYLFDELQHFDLLPVESEYNSKIRDYRFFVKDDSQRSSFSNLKGLKQSYISNKNSAPRQHEIIDGIINRIKQSEDK